MLGLGLASSHAPGMFCPLDIWPRVYGAIPDYTRESQPAAAKLETREVLEKYSIRMNAAFDVLRQQLETYRADALIMIGDHHIDLFNNSNMPTLAVFTGNEVWGSSKPFYMDDPPEASRIHIPVHTELAAFVLKGLLKHGFDLSNIGAMQPLGDPERGVSHMIVLPAPKLMPKLDLPIIPIFLNANFPPLPTARRCWELGLALRDLLATRKERIAIYASGGLSHDPFGPRAGWIDEPLDRWVLERLESGRAEELTTLFTFDSDTVRGGTAEIRAWIAVAGACQRPAKIVEYLPCHHIKVGLGWAYWPVVE
jgi:hypothetical protein